jgi:hypothetical protein
VRRATIVSVACAVTLVAGTASAAVVPGLRSPSGNIRCVYAAPTDARNRGALFCTIAHASYAARLQNRCLNPNGEQGAGVDWHGFMLGVKGRGEVVCSGGALWFGTPGYRTVSYGRSWHAGPYTCASRPTGVTCTNRRGHGLFLSRESYRLW